MLYHYRRIYQTSSHDAQFSYDTHEFSELAKSYNSTDITSESSESLFIKDKNWNEIIPNHERLEVS